MSWTKGTGGEGRGSRPRAERLISGWHLAGSPRLWQLCPPDRSEAPGNPRRGSALPWLPRPRPRPDRGRGRTGRGTPPSLSGQGQMAAPPGRGVSGSQISRRVLAPAPSILCREKPPAWAWGAVLPLTAGDLGQTGLRSPSPSEDADAGRAGPAGPKDSGYEEPPAGRLAWGKGAHSVFSSGLHSLGRLPVPESPGGCPPPPGCPPAPARPGPAEPWAQPP